VNDLNRQEAASIADGHATARVHRDVLRSALIGPLRFLVPVVGYFILYPILLEHAGLAVLGLWSVLSTLITYVGMADIGFSQLITREAGRDRDKAALEKVRREYLTARRVYLFIAIVLLGGLAALGTRPFQGLAEYYSPQALCVSVGILIIAATCQITARLDAAVLAARNDNHGVQMVLVITPAFPFAASVIGALMGFPIEGLSTGALLAALAQLVIFRLRLRRRHGDWQTREASLTLRGSLVELPDLLRRGAHFYAISIGFVLREPVFRLVIGFALGPAAIGVYDIAMRITRTVREVAAAGFIALFPGFAVLLRATARDSAARLLRVSFQTLMAVGGFGFLLLVLFAAPFYSFWLDGGPAGLGTITRILILGNLITLANVPFWYLLQASGNERLGAYALWVQTAAVLLLIPAVGFFHMTLPGVMIYWVLSEILMLGMIFWFCETRLDLFLAALVNKRTALLCLLVAGFLGAAYWLTGYGESSGTLIWRGVLAGAFGFTVLPVIWSPLGDFIARARSVSGTATAP